MPFDALALDRSVRSYDKDGRLHVAVSHISKACVNPYRGDEIPKARELGLDPGRVYQLLRDPEELARSVPTWNGMPLMIKHRPQSANDHDREIVVGSLGTDAAFRAPYLDNSLAIWDGEGIAGVESGQIRQISCGYHYDADMTPGEFEGVAYDGVMRNIAGNHATLVSDGRAGNDVIVMDSAFRAMDAKPKGNHMVKQVATITPRTAVAMGALQVYLPPKLAADAKLPNLGRLLRGAKSGKEITSRVTTAMKPLLAKDANLSDLGGLIDALKGPEANAGRPAEGPQAIKTENPADTGLGDPEGTNEEMLSEDDDLEEKVRELLAGKLDDADLEMLMKLISPADPDAIVDPDASADPDDLGAPSADPPDTAPPEAKPDVDDDSSGKTEVHVHPPGGKKDDDAKDRGMFGRDRRAVARDRRVGRDAEPPQLEKENSVDKPAMDAAIKAASTAAVADAISQTTRRLNARSDAERFVRPWIGEVTVAMDTAEDVLGFALKAMNVPAKGITTADGMKTLLSLVPKPGDARPSPRMAADSAGAADFATRFPGASRLRVVG